MKEGIKEGRGRKGKEGEGRNGREGGKVSPFLEQ